MRAPLLSLACGALGAFSVLEACATADASTPRHDDTPHVIPEASIDVGADAADASAEPCDDCEYFPAECADDRLCPNGPFNPGDPTSLDLRTRVNAIRGRSSSDVWIAGALGAIAHFDGTKWTPSDPGTDNSMRAIWLRGQAEILVTTPFVVHTRGLTLDDDTGADAGSPSPGGWRTRAVASTEWPSSVGTLTSGWAAEGAEWTWFTTQTTSGGGTGLWRMHFVPEAQRFELEKGGRTGCSTLRCGSLSSIHGISANDLWAVGGLGAAVHITDADSNQPKLKGYNTKTWNALNAVWAASANDVWAVGEGGVIVHYTGDEITWERVPDVPTTERLNAIAGASPSDLWAVGDKGVALHYDGKSWTRVKIAQLDAQRRPDLTSVWMPSPNHVWIGGQGILLSLGGKP